MLWSRLRIPVQHPIFPPEHSKVTFKRTKHVVDLVQRVVKLRGLVEDIDRLFGGLVTDLDGLVEELIRLLGALLLLLVRLGNNFFKKQKR